jgi:ribosome biogenesis SPOUT family RNA methylase Rps3
MTTFIIEHLEPKLSKWCIIEYERISSIVGKQNLWFTSVTSKSDRSKLSKLGKVSKESVKELNLGYVCVLDPESEVELTSADKERYRYFVFGGILGDYPPRKRTKKELTQFLPGAATRNIGNKQFSTDNAVFVVKEILDGKKMSDLRFKERLEISINDVESIILPYRYPVIDGKPLISSKIIDLLKKKKGM